MKTLAIYNLKGGVGKTAAAVNLAYLAADYGYRTLLWDLDPQGAASWYFHVKPKLKGGVKKLVKGKHPIGEYVQATEYERLDILPADLSNRHLDTLLDGGKRASQRLASLLDPFAETYALVVLDCPPSISHLSENIFHTADILAAPLIPTPLSVRAYEQLVKFLAKERIKKIKLYPFLSMVDRHRNLHKQLMQALPLRIKTLLETSIPYASIVEQMGSQQKPLLAFNQSSPASRAYESLWRELDHLLQRP